MASKQTSSDTKVAVMASDISYIKDDVREIKHNLTQSYVSKEEFEPIKKIVYGLVGLIMVAVVGALMGLVLK